MMRRSDRSRNDRLTGQDVGLGPVDNTENVWRFADQYCMMSINADVEMPCRQASP